MTKENHGGAPNHGQLVARVKDLEARLDALTEQVGTVSALNEKHLRELVGLIVLGGVFVRDPYGADLFSDVSPVYDRITKAYGLLQDWLRQREAD